MYFEWIGRGCFSLYFVLSYLLWIAHLLCERRSIDRTTLNLCVYWYIFHWLLTRGLSRFSLLSFYVYTCLFSILTSGIRARFNDGVRFSGSIIDDWTRLEGGVHLDGCSSSCNLFNRSEDFVGEIVSERFSVLRHKFCKGDFGEEKQVVED